MIDTKQNLKGEVSITLTDADGNIKQKLTTSNTVVTAGKNAIASILGGADDVDLPSHMAIGRGGGTVVKDDQTELVDKLAIRAFDADATVDDNVVTYTATFGVGVGTGGVTEVGLFNGADAGDTMFARAIFGIVTKEAGDSMKQTWKITIG